MPQMIFFGIFFEKVEICYLKERFNKMEIEIYSENKRQLKRIRKPRRNIGQEGFEISLTVWQKSKKNSLSKTFALFSRFEYFFFRVLKTKIRSYRTLWCPSWFLLSKFCITIIAMITRCEYHEFLDTLPYASFIVLVHLWWVTLFANVFLLAWLPFATLPVCQQVRQMKYKYCTCRCNCWFAKSV